MKEFSWTISYTLSLPFPVFLSLTSLVNRVRADHAIDEFFTPYTAVKCGREAANRLFQARGGFSLREPEKEAPPYTEEMLARAMETLDRINRENAEKMNRAAAG